MEFSHHQALLAGYGTAMCGWLALRSITTRRATHRDRTPLWPTPVQPEFARPWREFGLAILAAVATLGVGQLAQHGFVFGTGASLDSLRQILVFAPMILLLAWRRHSPETAWLPLRRVPVRVACGTLLALAATVSFYAVRMTLDSWPRLVGFVYQPAHIRFAIHVFLEDLTIAILFVRLAAAVRRPYAVAIAVSALFAAGHIPGMVGNGATWAELAPLLLDFGLGVFVLIVLFRAADIWWFWCVHFAMDMTQFAPVH